MINFNVKEPFKVMVRWNPAQFFKYKNGLLISNHLNK